jgi:APA family basic amino acid/polyamine antiporter
MIGAGIFLIPATLAAFGGISILGWMASAIGAFLLAKVFSTLSTRIRGKDGGPYAYAQAAFGDFIGFLIAWGYWISIWVSNAAIAIAFVSAMSVFFPVFGESPVWAVLTGLSAIWFLSWINTLGIRSSGWVQLLTTLLKIVPILLIIFGGIFFFDASNFVPFNVGEESPFAAIAITGTITLYAFLGIESATVPAGNIRDPEKTIARATLLGTGFTTLLYVLSTIVIMGMIPMEDLANSPSPFADAMGIMTGNWGRKLVAAGAAISAFGALNGWTLIMGQVPMATARDRLFPAVFKRINERGVPALGIFIGSMLASLVMLMNYTEGLVEQFRFVILLTTFCMLVPYLFTAAAYLIIMTREKISQQAGWAILIIGSASFLYSLWGMYGAGETTIAWGFMLLMAGVPFYVWIKWKNKNGNSA